MRRKNLIDQMMKAEEEMAKIKRRLLGEGHEVIGDVVYIRVGPGEEVVFDGEGLTIKPARLVEQ